MAYRRWGVENNSPKPWAQILMGFWEMKELLFKRMEVLVSVIKMF